MKGWIQAVLSVLAAFLGVQSDEYRVRDFEQGRFSVFVVAGLLMTLTFWLVCTGLSNWS